jgi:hypothetical protein
VAAQHPYSTVFIAEADLTGWSVYVVPAGSRAVLKSVTVSKAAANSSTPQVLVNGITLVSIELTASPTWQTYVWEGMAVAMEGQDISALGDGHSNIVVAGYLLTEG